MKKEKGTVEILNNGALLLFSNGEYNQFETADELEIYTFKNKIKIIPKGKADEQSTND